MKYIKTAVKVVLLAIVGGIIVFCMGVVCGIFYHLATNTFYEGRNIVGHFLTNPLAAPLLMPFVSLALLGWVFLKHNMIYIICSTLITAMAAVYVVCFQKDECDSDII